MSYHERTDRFPIFPEFRRATPGLRRKLIISRLRKFLRKISSNGADEYLLGRLVQTSLRVSSEKSIRIVRKIEIAGDGVLIRPDSDAYRIKRVA